MDITGWIVKHVHQTYAAHHDLYHAAQIFVLRRLFKEGPR